MSEERKNTYRSAYVEVLSYPVRYMEEQCESEIERLFLLAALAPDDVERLVTVPDDLVAKIGARAISANQAWSRIWAHVPAYPQLGAGPSVEIPSMRHAYCAADACFYLVPQWPLVVDGKPYRLDFAAIPERSGACPPFAIELDGHDFHERTKEQAARDRSRDRALSKAGWQVLRFTGSELWKDPMRCVRDMRDAILWEGARRDELTADCLRAMHAPRNVGART